MKKIYAVVVGCNYSGTPYKLDGCINDAMDFSWTITDLCDKRNNALNLNLLLDNGANPPTGSNVLANIRQGIAAVNSGNSDLFLFYFAGHGLQQKDKNGDEADGLDETILCSDLTQIVDDQMFLALTRLKRNRQAIFVFDCCHSGTMLDLPKTMIGGGKSGRMRLSGDVLCLSACLESQKATERNGRGLFTSALCATLRKRGGNTPLMPLLRSTQKYVRSQTNDMTVSVTSSGSVRAANMSLFNLNKSNNNKGKKNQNQRGIKNPVFRQYGGDADGEYNQAPVAVWGRPVRPYVVGKPGRIGRPGRLGRIGRPGRMGRIGGRRRSKQNKQRHGEHNHRHQKGKHRHRGKKGKKNRKDKQRGEPEGLKDNKNGKCVMALNIPWKEKKSHRTCSCQ